MFKTVVYRQFTKDFAKPVANQPGNEGIQGPLLHARVGDTLLVHFRNLDTLTNQPALDALPRRAVPVRLRRRVHPRVLRAGRERQAGGDVHLPPRGGAGLGRGLAVSRPFAVDDATRSKGASTARSRSSGRTSSAPDHEFVVYLESHLGFMTIDGRAFVGNTPVLPGEGRRPRPVGRARARRRLPHLPRARPPLDDRRTGRATRRSSGRRRATRSAGARTRPGRGSTTATSRAT